MAFMFALKLSPGQPQASR